MSNDLPNHTGRKATHLERLQAELSRNDHVLFLVVEAIGTMHGAFRRWKDRRRARRALAELDDQQLHDIGLERGDIVFVSSTWTSPLERSYRALARLDDSQVGNLSVMGRKLRKAARRVHSLD